MKEYLEASDVIDWKHPEVLSLARELAHGCPSQTDVARRCFEWVRDTVKHSWDHKLNPVTCRASDVLRHKTGYCFAKSHLLAALLRANGIPAGFCYQRLSREGDGPPYCLHGLNAVYLEKHGWYRVDARGNKDETHAEFSPPVERLAFLPEGAGEADMPDIWPSPLDCVLDVLSNCSTYEDVYENLPDIDLSQSQSGKCA
jgi:transglutaminase-like putative cysteine protease